MNGDDQIDRSPNFEAGDPGSTDTVSSKEGVMIRPGSSLRPDPSFEPVDLILHDKWWIAATRV